MEIRKILIPVIGIALCSMLFASCNKDSDTVFSAHIEQYNGTKDYVDNGNKIYWSDGDRLKINNGTYTVNVAGDDATINAEGVTDYGGQYYAAYPDSYAAIAANGTISFTLPEKEAYRETAGRQVVNSVMTAKTSTSRLDFKNVCALLHFSLSSSVDGSRLCAVEVSSDKALWGTMTVTYDGDNPLVTPPALAANTTRRLTFATPIELSSTAKDLYLIVPQVSGASTFTLRYVIETSAGDVKIFNKTKESSGIAFEKGNIYHFTTNTFDGSRLDGALDAETMDGSEDHPYQVYSTTSWDALMTAAVAGNTLKYISLANDISVTSSYSEFKATLDGNNHQINLANNISLFTQITNGTVRNVVLNSGSCTAPTYYTVGSTRYFGSLVCKATSATVENCISNVDISFFNDANSANIGGICGMASSSTFSNCSNSGNITSNSTHIGGIVGVASSSVSISGCTNSGNIIIPSAMASNNTSVYWGGIAGQTSGGTVIGCHNEGKMVVSYVPTTNPAAAYIGGIFGQGNCNISNCSNADSIICKATSANSIFIGGIIGFVSSITEYTMLNCKNEGHINVETITLNSYAGGLVGSNKHTHIKNSYAFCNIKANRVAGIVSGLYDALSSSTDITNCYYYGTIESRNDAYGISAQGFSAGCKYDITYCFYPDGSTMTGANNTGSNNTLINDPNTSSMASSLTTHKPANGLDWTTGTTHVVFSNSK